MKRLLAVLWIVILCILLLLYSFQETAPVSQEQPLPTQTSETEPEPAPQLTFLNGQPVLQLIWDQLSEEFSLQTGIQVKTVSSEEHLLGHEPVLFSVSGPEELRQRQCLDLKDTVAYANLASDDFTLKRDGKVWGIASEAEPFGLIYNRALLARVGYTDADIDSFSDLRTVADLITKSREDLGFGAFAQPDSTGRFAALLAALPEDIRPFWDLYSANLASGTLSEEKAVFQLGTLTDLERLLAGGELQLGMLPLYTGAPGEEERGLHCFGKHYWCVREDASEEEIAGALAFLNFMVSPRTDGTVPADDLGILAPYRQAIYANDPVEQRFRSDIALGKEMMVCGAEVPAPEGFADALVTYAADPTEEKWAAVDWLIE